MKPRLMLLTAFVGALCASLPVIAQETGQTEQSADKAPALTVTVATPLEESWPDTVPASGWLAAWHEAVVSAELSGQRIIAVNADVGSVVQKGDVLVELSSESIESDKQQQEASVSSAQAALDQATEDANRARRLQGTGAISEQQVSEYLITERKAKADLASAEAALATNELNLARTKILAVDGGVISSRSAALGDVVTSGAEMFRLIRQRRIEWQAEIPLRYLLKVSEGTVAKIPTPLGEITGTVRLIAPTASEKTGRITTYVTLQEPKNAPPPKTGILVSGQFVVGDSIALSVPATAVTMQDGFSYCFILDGKDVSTVTRKRVATGRRQGQRVEVIEGLTKDDLVVQSGGAFLSDGSVVRVVDAATNEGGGQK